MKHIKIFEEFINEFGGDFTKEYDGFIVLDVKNQKAWKFRYIKGTKGVKAEDEAIAQVMKMTGQPRGVFMVHGSIKKGEFDKTDEISGIKLGVVESVNEAKQNIESFMNTLEKKYGFNSVRSSEDFNGSKGGIWVSGENGETLGGKTIYSYYASGPAYELGVLKKYEEAINKLGWYSEWHDPGTVMIWPI
jgi:hypothetical protein